MGAYSRLQKLSAAAIGIIGGGLVYYRLTSKEQKLFTLNSTTNTYTPKVKWDHNWDHRDPRSLVKPKKNDSPEEENRYNTNLENAKPKATRHLFLIRHGQYHESGTTDKEKFLTDLGRKQANFTGEQLAKLDIKWDVLVRSTMTRAQETGEIILKHLPESLTVKDCQLIEEGAPIPPEPSHPTWEPEYWHFFQEGARIEAGFRKYFHRASPDQQKDTYTILVCHGNVIRYFVCKALQFPPEAWLRISLNHASITHLTIHPNGIVTLRGLGECGFMAPQYRTFR